MNDLTKRVLLAVPGALIFLFVLWMGGWTFLAAMTLLALLVQREMIIVVDHAGYKVSHIFTFLFGLWVMSWPVVLPEYQVWPGLILFLIFIATMVLSKSDYFLSRFLGTLFPGLYAPVGFMALVQLRWYEPNTWGLFLSLTVVFMVWGNDVLAYFGGKNLGKHLLAPAISPKKTWEGFLFGILGAAIGFGLCTLVVPDSPDIPIAIVVPLVVLVSIFGPVGDLAESRLKRIAGIKDSSSLLPGHGGLFDRFDAMILSALSVYLYFQILELLNYATF